VQAGPAGGAGLELSYSWGNGWTLGGGAAYRDYRFRLRSDGPTPNGIGQNSGTPVFARLRYTFNPAAHIDLYAGAVVGGRLKVLDASGATLQQSDYGTSPLLALSGSISF
jgi:outer membrane receptor protein involved in Fe transport